MKQYLCTHAVVRAPPLANRIAAASLSALLVGCAMAGSPGLSDSSLRQALDQLNKTRPAVAPVLDVTDTVLKFIPLGTPEKQAVDALSSAGLQPVGGGSQS